MEGGLWVVKRERLLGKELVGHSLGAPLLSEAHALRDSPATVHDLFENHKRLSCCSCLFAPQQLRLRAVVIVPRLGSGRFAVCVQGPNRQVPKLQRP